MISEENKIFLKEKFNIDIDTYSRENLNEILDEILETLDQSIIQKEIDNLELMKNVVINSSSTDDDKI